MDPSTPVTPGVPPDAGTPTVTNVSVEEALKAGDNQRVSATDILPRNVDNRSGNTTVNNAQGKVLEMGMASDKTYNLTFYAAGNPVAKFGQQADNTYSLKFFDSSGIGLAQFGQYPGGHVALKIAKAGYEVSTATNDQLVFNSDQDILKVSAIVTGSISVSFSSHSSGASVYIDGSDTTTTLTMAHNLGFTPVLNPQILNNATATYEPVSSQAVCDILNGGGLYTGPYSFGLSTWKIYADSTNVYVTANRSYAVTAAGQSVAAQSGSANFKVYCLQETAN